MSPPPRNTAGDTTLDGILNAMMTLASSMQALSEAQSSTATAHDTMCASTKASAATQLAESQKQTALLQQILDQLKKGLLVKVVTLL